MEKVLSRLCWLMLALEAALWLGLRTADWNVVSTLFAYGPRWVCLVPPILLLPAVLVRPRLWIPVTAGVVFALGPIMQFRMPFFSRAPTNDTTITLLTLNTGRRVSADRLRHIVEDVGAQIVVLQECTDLDLKAAFGWQVGCAGSLCGQSLPYRISTNA